MSSVFNALVLALAGFQLWSIREEWPELLAQAEVAGECLARGETVRERRERLRMHQAAGRIRWLTSRGMRSRRSTS